MTLMMSHPRFPSTFPVVAVPNRPVSMAHPEYMYLGCKPVIGQTLEMENFLFFQSVRIFIYSSKR